MKKSLMLTIACFVLALGVGLSLTTESNEVQVDSLLASSSYEYRDYHAGDVSQNYPSFTVHYSGELLGCNGPIFNPGNMGYTFTAEYLNKGNNQCIGEVVTRQSTGIVIYRIYVNVR